MKRIWNEVCGWQRVLFALGMAVIGLWLRWIYPNLPLVEGFPFMADGDCYTRLHRVSLIVAGKGWIWGFHDFENYPFGIVPHTTFPLDGLLAALTLLLKPFLESPLDWAGLLISPLLFLLIIGTIHYFSQKESETKEGEKIGGSIYSPFVLIVGWALLPGLIWGTPFARPDHQSLVVVLIFLALWGEERRWRVGGGRWEVAMGSLWGMSLWVSLYEPFIVLGILGVMNLIIRHREQKRFWGVIAVLFLLTQGIEGFRFLDLHAMRERNLSTWFQTIGETRGMGVEDFFLIFTVTTLFIPFFIFRFRSKVKISPTILVMIGITLVLVGLTLFQRRWLYFSIIPPLLLFAVIWSWLSQTWKWAMGIIFLMNIVISTSHLKSDPTQEPPIAVEAKLLAKSIQGTGGILAPWWISPSLLYFSGEPIVASTSHQSIAGIVASSQFYRGSHWLEAERILRERKVRWVVAYDEDRVLQNASETLGLAIPADPRASWAGGLWRVERIPTALKLRAATTHLRLYEFTHTEN